MPSSDACRNSSANEWSFGWNRGFRCPNSETRPHLFVPKLLHGNALPRQSHRLRLPSSGCVVFQVPVRELCQCAAWPRSLRGPGLHPIRNLLAMPQASECGPIHAIVVPIVRVPDEQMLCAGLVQAMRRVKYVSAGN